MLYHMLYHMLLLATIDARKILCLHGGGGNGPSFSYSTSDLRDALGSDYGVLWGA